MVNEEILGALNSALARGESLKKAMMTLFNAGYKKEEISEAARSVQKFAPSTKPQTPTTEDSKKSKIKKPKKINPGVDIQNLAPSGKLAPKTDQASQPAEQQVPGQTPQQGSQAPQRVSGYGKPPKPAGKIIIIILGFLLLLLVGILVTIFLFKEELIGFFNNMFN